MRNWHRLLVAAIGGGLVTLVVVSAQQGRADVITPSAEGATGRVYLIEVWGGTDPSHVVRAGGYEDVYVRTPDGWRFQSRAHVRDKAWHHPALQTPTLQSPPRPTPGPLGQPRPAQPPPGGAPR